MEYARHLTYLAEQALKQGRTAEAKDWLCLALEAVPGRKGQRKGRALAMAAYVASALDQLNGINATATMKWR